MAELRTIEIDFDIYKVIQAERRTFSEPEYSALRRLLGLGDPTPSPRPQPAESQATGGVSVGAGVYLPNGTKLRMTLHGQKHLAEVRDGAIHVNNGREYTLSGAAMRITKYNVNGWRVWYAQLPGSEEWKSLLALRRAQRI